MIEAAPPAPPTVALGDDDRVQKLNHRLWLLSMTLITILVTAWFITVSWVAGILALVVAKHVLVAILVMALGVDAQRPASSRRPDR